MYIYIYIHMEKAFKWVTLEGVQIKTFRNSCSTQTTQLRLRLLSSGMFLEVFVLTMLYYTMLCYTIICYTILYYDILYSTIDLPIYYISIYVYTYIHISLYIIIIIITIIIIIIIIIKT